MNGASVSIAQAFGENSTPALCPGVVPANWYFASSCNIFLLDAVEALVLDDDVGELLDELVADEPVVLAAWLAFPVHAVPALFRPREVSWGRGGKGGEGLAEGRGSFRGGMKAHAKKKTSKKTNSKTCGGEKAFDGCLKQQKSRARGDALEDAVAAAVADDVAAEHAEGDLGRRRHL